MTMTTRNCGALVQDGRKAVRPNVERKRIRSVDNSTKERKLIPKVPKVTDIFVD